MKSLLGIDIGSGSLKLVGLERKRGRFFLKSLGETILPQRLLSSESEEGLSTLSSYLKNLIKDAGCHTNNVSSAIPSEEVFTAVLNLPQMPENELAYAMKWEIKKQVGDYPEKKVASWEVIDQKNGLEIFLVTTPKDLVNKYLNILKTSGLNPITLEIEPVALTRSLTNEGEDAIIIHLGVSFSTCSLVESGNLKVVRNLKVGENEMVRSLAGIGKESENKKKILYECGFLKSKRKGEVYKALKPSAETVVSEFKRLSNYFLEKTKKEISKVYVAGGCINIPNLVDYLSQAISLEVKVANPWAKIDCSGIKNSEQLVKMGPRFAVACGLAMA